MIDAQSIEELDERMAELDRKSLEAAGISLCAQSFREAYGNAE